MMKRFVVLLVSVAALIVAAGTIFADGLDFMTVTISGVIKLSGGNKNVGLDEAYSKGFDIREQLRQIHSKCGDSDVVKMLYPEFNDSTWADLKFRASLPTEKRSVLEAISYESRNVSITPKGKMPGKPIPQKSIPSAKNGLLNPGNPVKIMTENNILTLNGVYHTRLLDSKGKELARINPSTLGPDTIGKIELRLSESARDYYLELSEELDNRTKRYCYILLNIQPDPVKPAEDKRVTEYIAQMESHMQEGQRKLQSYMDRHGINDTEQLTEDDMFTMTKENISSAPVEAQQQVLSSMEIMQKYMREHNIASMQDLTDKDEEAIRGLFLKNTSASWPPAYRAAVDKYMKQHKISGYEKLTDKDLEAISKQFEKQTSKKNKRK